jgi:nitrate reductase gamma subunit
MPDVVAIHVIVAFVILALIPFTRLVHFLVVPLSYITRPYQQVVWNWNRKRIRDTKEAWSDARPRNN